MEQQEGENDLPSMPVARSCLCNYCSCCVKAVCREPGKQRITSQLASGLAGGPFADEVNWDAVAEQFSLSLRTYIGSLSSKRD